MKPYIISNIENHKFININTFIMKISFNNRTFKEKISRFNFYYIYVNDINQTKKYKQYTPFKVIYFNNKIILYLIIRIDNPYGLSKYLSQLKKNDKILISDPYNDLRSSTKLSPNIICLAGGTGISAFIQLFNRLLENPKKLLFYKNIYFIVANRSKHNILLPKYIKDISTKMNKYCYFNYINIYDKPYEYAINETFLKNFLKNKKNYSIKCIGRDKFCNEISIILTRLIF